MYSLLHSYALESILKKKKRKQEIVSFRLPSDFKDIAQEGV